METCCGLLPPWPVAPFRRASCCESSWPIRASANWPSLSAKSDGSTERSSSSTGCSTPICSAGPTQGRGSSRAQERTPDRVPGRNPRPLDRGPALPHGRAQPARHHRHSLEYRRSRRSGQTAETRRPDGRARAPGQHLTPWVGPHPAHWRIPMAKAPIADLAYDPAPYRSRPVKAKTQVLLDIPAVTFVDERPKGPTPEAKGSKLQRMQYPDITTRDGTYILSKVYRAHPNNSNR